MSDPPPSTCAHRECSEQAVRRCYFCDNVCCERHITVKNGAMCFACAQTEQEKQEERERAAQEAQARAKASGCMMALVLPAGLLLVPLIRLRPRFRRWGRLFRA